MPNLRAVLQHFSQIFLICKILGIYPQNLQTFQHGKSLQKSKLGAGLVLAALLTIVGFYSWLIYSFEEDDRSLKETQSTLTIVIGLFLTYIGLAMMATDQLTAIRNQDSIGAVFDRIMTVDERLFRENIEIDNSTITTKIRFMIMLTVGCELIILTSSYVLLVDYTKWISILWIFTRVPTFYSSLDKIWFAGMLNALKQRFQAINTALEEMVETHEKLKSLSLESNIETSTPMDSHLPPHSASQYDYNLSYLYKELNVLEKNSFKGSVKNKVAPIATSFNSFGEGIDTPQKPKSMIIMAHESELSNISRIEEKLNNFCQLHDEICEIGKNLNELWSYPILVLMAYGFLIFTAQLYFLYCATQDQAIPSLFRSAKNPWITTISLAYTSGKCVYLIYLSWKTALESKRTGICLHKCGVAADNNSLYEIVSGGITSYLIILIQFNLAAQQAKEAVHTFSNFNETANLIAAEGGVTQLINYVTTTIISTTTNANNYVTN